ncbi:hypothetical protein M378DRAFT_176561 [Amanita muscaria Koide BX008]|uniref:Uncharacterized protein n=1 Tax=Amanita muscaria (strain Koide BX008) TaxID=946122 RepID=A0A0C2SZR1_AMAMK|nr:hypothetical protein M378DRAFT_176561 [Amanita muscaria Koide BX008]
MPPVRNSLSPEEKLKRAEWRRRLATNAVYKYMSGSSSRTLTAEEREALTLEFVSDDEDDTQGVHLLIFCYFSQFLADINTKMDNMHIVKKPLCIMTVRQPFVRKGATITTRHPWYIEHRDSESDEYVSESESEDEDDDEPTTSSVKE